MENFEQHVNELNTIETPLRDLKKRQKNHTAALKRLFVESGEDELTINNVTLSWKESKPKTLSLKNIDEMDFIDDETKAAIQTYLNTKESRRRVVIKKCKTDSEAKMTEYIDEDVANDSD